MRLYTKCKNCKKHFNFKGSATDRFGLAKKMGDKFSLVCPKCQTKKNYNPNDVKAEEDPKINLIALLILIIGSISVCVYIWEWIWSMANVYAISSMAGLIAIPSMFYFAIKSEHQQRVRYFNAMRFG